MPCIVTLQEVWVSLGIAKVKTKSFKNFWDLDHKPDFTKIYSTVPWPMLCHTKKIIKIV